MKRKICKTSNKNNNKKKKIWKTDKKEDREKEDLVKHIQIKKIIKKRKFGKQDEK